MRILLVLLNYKRRKRKKKNKFINNTAKLHNYLNNKIFKFKIDNEIEKILQNKGRKN